MITNKFRNQERTQRSCGERGIRKHEGKKEEMEELVRRSRRLVGGG
jgi:hypothetical protein